VSRLEEDFRDALDARGLDVDEANRRLAVDLARLLIRASGARVKAQERLTLDAALAARTSLPAQAREALLDLALSPRFRAAVSPAELLAFGGRFGSAARDRLASEQAEEMDLAGFAAQYGTEASLLLMDGLFRVASADGCIEPREARVLAISADELGIDGVLVSALFQKYDPRHAAGDLSWDLNKERLSVGRAAGNDVVLPDPQVARHHCDLVRDPTGWRVVDAGSGRPVLVDGKPVLQAVLAKHNKIRIGPWRLQVVQETDGSWRVHAFGHRSFTSLSVNDLTRHIGKVCLLDRVRFTVFSGEVVALVGPSGSGKTTLINAISGIALADRGDVLLDGESFHDILKVDRTAVGLVPQEDLVHPMLTVGESLYFAGKLRLPSDVSSRELEGTVDRVVQELGIAHIRDSIIGDALKRGISGGQRKRVNLAQELLTRTTRVLFLDEPTSGLDPRSAQDIARLVRQLADDGRIVFLVTHDLTPGIMAQCDHLLVLAPGGRLAWFGPPAEACLYFGVPSPDLIFSVLSEKSPEDWKARFDKSLEHRKYVATREHLLKPGEDASGTGSSTSSRSRGPSRLTQFRTLVRRYARRKLRDETGMLVMVAQPLLLALTT
jgi:ABC-type multidrug transport system ATPase subunit